MNHPSQKRVTTLADPNDRLKHLGLLIFSGFEAATAGGISLTSVQTRLLHEYPELLKRFSQFENYFALSTWIAFVGGLLFELFPVTFTVWLGHYFVAMSLGYLILAARGIADTSAAGLPIAYWAVIITPILLRLGDIGFYVKNTILDFYIYIAMSIGLIVWAYLEFAKATH